MPVVSQAQRRWAYATAEGKTGTDPKVGRDFVESSHGIKGLPEYVSGGHPELNRLTHRKPSYNVDHVIQAALKRNGQ